MPATLNCMNDCPNCGALGEHDCAPSLYDNSDLKYLNQKYMQTETPPPAVEAEIVIPDNVEEIIAAYLAQQFGRVKSARVHTSDYISVSVGLSEYCGAPILACWVSTQMNDKIGVPTTRGSSLSATATAHIEASKAFNPIAAKRAEIERLAMELSNLELAEQERGAA